MDFIDISGIMMSHLSKHKGINETFGDRSGSSIMLSICASATTISCFY